ncbi:MAG: hypothetical protein JOZ24_05695 [Candidatus Eremiobacteraeota bacterium]|nr:hypothetical protein [Candidatus Eremiobacteraeota bacterium]
MSTRRIFIGATAAGAAAAAATRGASAAGSGTILDEAAFRRRIATGARHKQMIGAARVNDGAVLQYAVNTLNGFTNGWNEPPSQVQIVLVLFGSAAAIGLDDAMWREHRLQEIVRRYSADFLTADAAQTNIWARPDAARQPNADKSLPSLLRRGVRIFVCNTALGELSNRIVADGTAPGMDAFAVQAALRTHVVPGLDIVPAGISAVSVLQQSGYTFFTAAL